MKYGLRLDIFIKESPLYGYCLIYKNGIIPFKYYKKLGLVRSAFAILPKISIPIFKELYTKIKTFTYQVYVNGVFIDLSISTNFGKMVEFLPEGYMKLC